MDRIVGIDDAVSEMEDPQPNKRKSYRITDESSENGGEDIEAEYS